MMYDFEYNNIIDYWSKEFHIHVPEKSRGDIIKSFELNDDYFKDIDLDFNLFCEHLMLKEYCSSKYPYLNLYDYAFSIWAMN